MTTSLSIVEARAQILHGLLLQHRVERVEDIPEIPRLSGWSPRIISSAIDELVATGRLEENAHGQLIVHEVTTR